MYRPKYKSNYRYTDKQTYISQTNLFLTILQQLRPNHGQTRGLQASVYIIYSMTFIYALKPLHLYIYIVDLFCRGLLKFKGLANFPANEKEKMLILGSF